MGGKVILCTTLYISLGILYIKYIGARGNDCTAHGYLEVVEAEVRRLPHLRFARALTAAAPPSRFAP